VILITPFISLVLYKFFYIWLIYLFFLWLILYFSREKALAIVLIVLLNVGVGVGFPYMWDMLKDYQKMRIVAFLNPNIDPQGMGYHTLQSKIAVGAGGIFGRGYLRGSQTQLHFIPEQHSDFVFSAVAEEFGFLGVMLVMGVVLFLIWRFIGMTLGLLPVVGIPFPFLSFGGTSLVMNMTAIGIIQSIAMRRRKIIF
jgi:rod shape determining protein RodA